MDLGAAAAFGERAGRGVAGCGRRRGRRRQAARPRRAWEPGRSTLPSRAWCAGRAGRSTRRRRERGPPARREPACATRFGPRWPPGVAPSRARGSSASRLLRASAPERAAPDGREHVLQLLQVEGGHELPGGGEALGRVLGEGAGEDLVVAHRERRVPPSRRRWHVVHHLVDHLRDRPALERRLAGQHLVGHDRERVHVGAAGHGLARDLLRRHVRRRAQDLAGGGHHRGLDAGHAEVHQLRLPVGLDHDVGGLDVAVDDAGAVSGVHRFRHRGQDAQGLLRLDAPLLADQAVERPALDVLHHQVVVAEVEDPHDRRVTEPARGLGLAAEALQVLVGRVAGQVLGLDRLDRDHAVDARVPGTVHAAHRPVADLVDDLVTAKPLWKHRPFSLAAVRR